MSGIFQLAADLWCLGFSLCVTLSFLHSWPTERFLRAKSWAENAAEMKLRGWLQQVLLLLALGFFVAWVLGSERLRKLLIDSGRLDVDKLWAVDSPQAPIWVLVCFFLDFFGKR